MENKLYFLFLVIFLKFTNFLKIFSKFRLKEPFKQQEYLLLLKKFKQVNCIFIIKTKPLDFQDYYQKLQKSLNHNNQIL